MDGGHIDATLLQLHHHWTDFQFRKDEVAHDGCVARAALERCPRPERKPCLNLRSVDRDIHVLARHREFKAAIWLHLAATPKRPFNWLPRCIALI